MWQAYLVKGSLKLLQLLKNSQLSPAASLLQKTVVLFFHLRVIAIAVVAKQPDRLEAVSKFKLSVVVILESTVFESVCLIETVQTANTQSALLSQLLVSLA
jgi:hypothetical protein